MEAAVMPKKKLSLEKRLEQMSEDIQIGGDVNFRAIGCAVVLARSTGVLSPKVVREAESLLRRANRLLDDLTEFWGRHPELEKLVDRGQIAAT
jgi:hypothetical protein